MQFEKNNALIDSSPNSKPIKSINININEDIPSYMSKSSKESLIINPKNEGEISDNDNYENSLKPRKKKKEIDLEENDSQLYISLGLINNFEKMHEFKTYFPHNNFSNIRNCYNERVSHLFNKKKINDLKKYFQYTFNPLLMYQKIKRKESLKSNKKKAHGINKKNNNFFSLLGNLMSINEEKKKSKKKWYSPFSKIFKKIK